jgi:3-deoxy-7-phosphoheptulonate synthase
VNPTHLQHVRDQRIERVVPLSSPEGLLEDLPLGEGGADLVIRGRSEVHSVLDRSDDRLLVVVGPCSVHDVAAALEYGRRLSDKAAELE